MKRFIFLLTACASLVAAVPAAHAADAFPTKPLTLVVPFPPGGPTDAMARTLAAEMKDRLGQPMIVENRAGAGGNIGAEYVARAEADGHTLMFGTSGPLAINKSLYRKINYDPVKSFAPVIQVGYLPNILVVNPALPVKTVPELVAYAKANPGKVNFASSGNGSAQHLAGEAFAKAAGVKMVHVPYKGTGPAMADLLSGRVDVMFSSLVGNMEHVADGRLVLIATTGAKRSPATPDVPTVDESGVKGFQAETWQAVLAPAGTPAPVVDRLNAALAKAGKSPKIVETLAAQGMEVRTTSPAELRDLLARDTTQYKSLLQQAKNTLQ